jgi:hypothetical protein
MASWFEALESCAAPSFFVRPPLQTIYSDRACGGYDERSMPHGSLKMMRTEEAGYLARVTHSGRERREWCGCAHQDQQIKAEAQAFGYDNDCKRRA